MSHPSVFIEPHHDRHHHHHPKLPPHSPNTVQLDQSVPPTAPTTLPRSPLVLTTAADVRSHVPTLLNWPPGPVSLTTLSGGMCNSLYKLSHPTRAPVVVRIFGQENVFSRATRELENHLVAELAAARLAPALPAVFANGRVEQFLVARPLDARDMTRPRVYPAVAREMVRFHRFRPSLHCGHHIASPPPPGVFPPPIALVERYRAESERLAADGRLAGFDLSRHTRALDTWMKRFRAHARCARGEGLVFAHNDLNPLNILRGDGDGDGDGDDDDDDDEEESSVAFIDFEFAGWNFKACEIALYFAEAVGEQMRYDLYPDAATLRDFCEVYLREECGGEKTVAEERVDELVADVELFDAFTHLLWGFWGLSRIASGDSSGYDFLEFAIGRFRACYHFHNWL